MKPYFSTFPAGTESIVEKALQSPILDVSVRDKYSGLVVYESSHSIDDIKRIRFFQNSFLLLYETQESLSLREILNRLRTNNVFVEKFKKALSKGVKSFKIVASLENQTVAIPPIQLKKLESYIVDETGLSIADKYQDTEIWIIQRREGFTLAGLRITFSGRHITKPEKGQLSSPITNILCLASDPSSEDVVLDPFAGHGGIIFERAIAFPYKKIIAIDKDPILVKKIKERAKNSYKNLIIEQDNAESLKLADESVDAIITDPPWGLYEKGDIKDLYQNMLTESYRILVKKGRLVVLTGAKNVFEEVLKQISGLELVTKTDVLVSGKKAAIYKLVKQ